MNNLIKILLILCVLVCWQCKNPSFTRKTDSNDIGKNILLDTLKREFYDNGTLKAVYREVNNCKNGLYLEYYQDSSLKCIKNYICDSLNGESLTYVNNQLVERCFYRNDIKEGYYQSYHFNDSLWFEGFCRNDEMNGAWILYDTNQKIQAIECRYPDTNYYLNIKKFSFEKKHDSIFDVKFYLPKDWYSIIDTRYENSIVYQVDEGSDEMPMFYRIQRTQNDDSSSIKSILDYVVQELKVEYEFLELHYLNVNDDEKLGACVCSILQYGEPYIYCYYVFRSDDWNVLITSSFPKEKYKPYMMYFEFLNDKIIHEIAHIIQG